VNKEAAIVLSYNHPELTVRAARSLLKFFKPEDIFVFHNGSRTAAIDQVCEKTSELPATNHLINPRNGGFAAGANGALNALAPSYSWVFFVTNDCVVTAYDRPSPLKPGLYAPRIERRRTGQVDSLGGVFNPARLQLRHQRESTHALNANEFFYVPGTAFLIHKNVWADVGSFDESLHTYWEDVDFSVRAATRGHPTQPLPTVVLEHGIGKTCHGDPFYSTYLFHRNRYRVSKKYGAHQLTVLKAASKEVTKHVLRRDWFRARLSVKSWLHSGTVVGSRSPGL
jgi:GT2 family glycosyltransferase